MNTHIYIFVFLLLICSSCGQKQTNTSNENTQNKIENVISDELINTFYEIDKALKDNSVFFRAESLDIISKLQKVAKEKSKYQTLVEKCHKTFKITDEFIHYINEVKERLIVESGGRYTYKEVMSQGLSELIDKPKKSKDFITVEKLFIGSNAEGSTIERKIITLKENYIKIITSFWDNGGIEGTVFAEEDKKKELIKRFVMELKLFSSEKYKPQLHDEKSWSDFTFGNQPVAAICSKLRMFQNEARLAEVTVLRFIEVFVDDI